MHLMHMDEVVAKVEIVNGQLGTISKIFSEQHMPVGVSSHSPNLLML